MSTCGALVALAFVGVYAYLLYRFRNNRYFIKSAVSTVAMILSHGQGLAIFSRVDLPWPPTTQAVMSYSGFSFMPNLRLGSPECLIPADTDVSPYFFFNIGAFSIVMNGASAAAEKLDEAPPRVAQGLEEDGGRLYSESKPER